MKQEAYSDEFSGFGKAQDAFDNDEEEGEEEEEDANAFGLGELFTKRCAIHASLLKPHELDGFMVRYCQQCKKPVCKWCGYPGLVVTTQISVGLVCTKCGRKYQRRSIP